MAVLWLAGDNFTGFAKSSKRGGGAERKVAIVCPDIDNTADASQCLLQPVVQFVLIKAEDFAERIARVHHDARTAERPSPDARGNRAVREEALKEAKRLHLIEPANTGVRR